MTKNKMADLNNHLFAQLERLAGDTALNALIGAALLQAKHLKNDVGYNRRPDWAYVGSWEHCAETYAMAIDEIIPADALAALERVKRAERERWQEAMTLIERVYYMEGKDAKWRAAHMNGIARDAQNGLGLAWARRMFPHDNEALSVARQVHAEEAAALRGDSE